MGEVDIEEKYKKEEEEVEKKRVARKAEPA